MTKSWASLNSSRLKAGLALLNSDSLPDPRTQPGTSRPPEIMSISASSSANRKGSATGRGLPSSTILTRLVIRARMAASTSIKAHLFGVDCLVQIGVIELAALDRVKVRVRHAKVAGVFDNLLFRHVVVGAFGETHDMHHVPPWLAIRSRTVAPVR